MLEHRLGGDGNFCVRDCGIVVTHRCSSRAAKKNRRLSLVRLLICSIRARKYAALARSGTEIVQLVGAPCRNERGGSVCLQGGPLAFHNMVSRESGRRGVRKSFSDDSGRKPYNIGNSGLFLDRKAVRHWTAQTPPCKFGLRVLPLAAMGRPNMAPRTLKPATVSD